MDCLVKKLKVSLDNNNLPLFNKVRFTVDAGSSKTFGVLSNNGVKFVLITGDATIKHGTTSLSFPYTYQSNYTPTSYGPNGYELTIASTNGCVIEVQDIYNLTYVYNCKFIPFDELPFCPLFYGIHIGIPSYKGVLEDTLGSKTDITHIMIRNSGITGCYEKFVAAQVKSGRATGSITLQDNDGILFNGSGTHVGNLSWQANSLDSSKTDVTIGSVTVTIDSEGNIVA